MNYEELKQAYSLLFNAMTDAINALKEKKNELELPIEEKVAIAILQTAQRKAEEIYVESAYDAESVQ